MKITQRDILELHKAEEIEKRSLFKLKQEEELIDNLLKLVEFIDSFVIILNRLCFAVNLRISLNKNY